MVCRGYIRPEDERREEVDVGDDEQPSMEGQGNDGGQASSGHGVGTIITSNGQLRGADLADDKDDELPLLFMISVLPI